jgi:hypothetical protein
MAVGSPLERLQEQTGRRPSQRSSTHASAPLAPDEPHYSATSRSTHATVVFMGSWDTTSQHRQECLGVASVWRSGRDCRRIG